MFFVWQKFLHRCLTTHEKNVYQGRTIIKWPRIDHPSKGGRNRREYLRQQPRKSCSNPIELRSSILPFLDDQNEAMEVKGKSWWIAGCFPLQQTQRFDLGFLLCPSRNKPCGSSAPSSSSTRQTKNVCDSPKVTRHHGPSSSWEKKLGIRGLLRSFSRAVVPSSLPAVQGDPHGGQAEGNLLDSLFSYLWALCFQIKASEMQSLHCTVCGSEWGASKNTSFYLSPPFFPKEQHRPARR